MSAATVKKQNRFSAWMSDFKAKSGIDKRRAVSDLLFNNAMYIIIAAAIIARWSIPPESSWGYRP